MLIPMILACAGGLMLLLAIIIEHYNKDKAMFAILSSIAVFLGAILFILIHIAERLIP